MRTPGVANEPGRCENAGAPLAVPFDGIERKMKTCSDLAAWSPLPGGLNGFARRPRMLCGASDFQTTAHRFT